MTLDLTSLKKAIDSLERCLAAANEIAKAGTGNANVVEGLRAGVIQNFEVTYEQSWKFIQRWIRENKSPDDADNPRTRKDLFRMAARYGLIDDPNPWFSYGDARNLTSHAYNSEQAAAVYESARLFLPDAKALLARLGSLHD